MDKRINYSKLDSSDFLERIYQYWDRLFYLALNLRGNREEAEDAVQETLIKATQKRHQFRGESNIYTWLVRILINFCHAKYQKEKNKGDSLIKFSKQKGEYQEMEIKDNREDPVKKIELSEQSDSLIQVIQELKSPLRAVVVLKYFENMSYQEIAQTLKIPEGTVKSRLNNARIVLKSLLDKIGMGV